MQLHNPSVSASEVPGMLSVSGQLNQQSVVFLLHWRDALSLSGKLERQAEQAKQQSGEPDTSEVNVARVG